MRAPLTIALSCLVPAMLLAQDTHYWGSHYSTAGFFLPGSVVAYNGDSSVLFYNPALLVHSNGPRISANANIYYLEKINLLNGAGTNRNLRSSASGSVPQLISGNFRLKDKPGINIAYGLISNNIIDFQATQRRDEVFNVLNDSYSPGNEFFVGQFIGQNTVKEFTGMVGIGFPITRRLSAGFYIEGANRKQKYELNYLSRALVNPPANDTFPLVSTDFDYFVSYSHQSLKLKVGFAWDGVNDHVGLLIQSPTWGIGGKGTIVADEVINNMPFGSAAFRLSLLANTRQENLKVKWKNPFSMALGYSRQLRKAMLYGAVEYFNRVNEYNIITPRPEAFVRPDTGQASESTQVLLKLRDARKAIWNIGVGGSYQLKEKVTVYMAFRTDNSYRSSKLSANDDGIVPDISTWNIYHWQAGLNLKRTKYNMRIGFYLSHGRDKNYTQVINFDNPSEDNFLLGDALSHPAKYFSAGLMLSYLHNF